MKLPTVTVGIPVYNGARYLDEAIKSILSQTYPEFILDISDNASTDGTKSICQKYQALDRRVRYTRQSYNVGAMDNFRLLAERAGTTYFMWIAHDDRLQPEFIEQAVRVLEAHSDCALVFSNYTLKNLETDAQKQVKVYPSDDIIAFKRCFQQLMRPRPSMIYGMHRTSVAKSTPLLNFDFSDLHHVICVSFLGRILILDEPLYVVGVKGERRPYSLTSGKIKRMPFVRAQAQFFLSQMNLIEGVILMLCSCALMFYNKIRLREG